MNRLTAWVLVAAGLGAVLATDTAPPPRRVADVAGLVRQLGSEEFADREAASRRLATLDVDDVPAELLAALKAAGPEVRERAAKAAKALREHIALNMEKAAVRHLPRGERFARLGQIDLYVASTAVSDLKADDPRLWEPALDVGRRLIARAETKGSREPKCPALFPDFAAYRVSNPSLRVARTDSGYARPEKTTFNYQQAIQAAGVTEPHSLFTLAVSRGPVRAAQITESLVLATGDVTSGDDLNNSVVVCDGDVRVARNVGKSVIIARGKITIDGTADSSTLIAGRTVAVAKPQGPGSRSMQHVVKVVVAESEVKPLGYVTFFELSAVGAKAEVTGKDVRVAAVADGGAFARAGVRVGDVVADVGGRKPDSAEALRRLLRDALALGDARVSLVRDGKPVAATVALPE